MRWVAVSRVEQRASLLAVRAARVDDFRDDLAAYLWVRVDEAERSQIGLPRLTISGEVNMPMAAPPRPPHRAPVPADPVLADLVAAQRTRRFPKMVRLPLETKTMTADDWRYATAVATDIFHRRFPDRDPRYYVHFDEPKRLSYKGDAGGAEPIRVTAPGGGARPVESDPRSLANNLSARLYVPRLFVPAEIREEVERALTPAA